MTAVGVYGEHSAKDPLYQGYHVFKKHYDLIINRNVIQSIKQGARFTSPSRLRFRKEDGFYLVNIRWGNSITLENETALFLLEHSKSGESFDLEKLGNGKEELMANLYFKDVIESNDINVVTQKDKLGLSFNFEALEPMQVS